MKRLSNLTKKQIVVIVIAGTLVFPLIIGLISFFSIDIDESRNWYKIDRMINNDSLIIEELGSILFLSKMTQSIKKIETSEQAYVMMQVDASDGKMAIIEYWVDKRNPVWKLDSVHIVKVWKY